MTNAPWGSWDALRPGVAWVRWCITEEAPDGDFIDDQRSVSVK